MQSTPKRKMTTPGLGETSKREKVTIREEDATPESRQNIVCPEPLVPDELAPVVGLFTEEELREPASEPGARRSGRRRGDEDRFAWSSVERASSRAREAGCLESASRSAVRLRALARRRHGHRRRHRGHR